MNKPRSDFSAEMEQSHRFSQWQPLTLEAIAAVPEAAGLFVVRASRNGEPIPIEHPRSIETSGILYIKGEENMRAALVALKLALDGRNARHPAANNYYSADGPNQWPLDGLQFRYTTDLSPKEKQR